VTEELHIEAAEAPPRAALRLRDPQRAQELSRALGASSVLAEEGEADVLVIDLDPGDPIPAEAAAFEGPVLLLSDDPAVMADAAHAGVLPRNAAPRLVAAAVAALAAGLSVRPYAAQEPAGFAERENHARPLLTPREVEVLALVGEGMSNKAIARRLNISAHTVKYHLEAIFAKLGVRSRAEAVTRGLRLGIHVL
jgi:two-component system nitrate/nitrite response regulator NarL